MAIDEVDVAAALGAETVTVPISRIKVLHVAFTLEFPGTIEEEEKSRLAIETMGRNIAERLFTFKKVLITKEVYSNKPDSILHESWVCAAEVRIIVPKGPPSGS